MKKAPIKLTLKRETLLRLATAGEDQQGGGQVAQPSNPPSMCAGFSYHTGTVC